MKYTYLVIGALLAYITAGAACAVTIGYQASLTAGTGGNTLLSTAGTSNVQATAQSGDVYQCDNGGTTWQLVKLDASVGSSVQAPDNFDAAFTVSVKVLDEDAGGDVTLTFTGRLQGYLTQRQSSLNAVPTGATTKTATLNGNTFSVTIVGFCPPGPPVDSRSGSLIAYITCAPTATAVSGVSITTAQIKEGRAVQGTVTLNGPAPRGGVKVLLSSNAPSALSVPPSVIVSEGQTSVGFIAAAVGAATSAQLTASWNGTTANKSVAITAGICGDFNGDGLVTAADVVRLLRAVAGLDVLPSC